MTGEAREIAQAHAKLALEAKAAGRKVAILSGGELEVTVRNAKGRGGRSQEYALALAIAIADHPVLLRWRPTPTASTAATARSPIPQAPWSIGARPAGRAMPMPKNISTTTMLRLFLKRQAG